MTDYEKLLYKLENRLNRMEANERDVLIRAEKGIRITKKVVERLRQKVIENDFADKTEEKDFFKRIKPHAVSRLIYYVKLHALESKRPIGDRKATKRYLRKEIKKLQAYFTDNLEFYNYYRRGSTTFDHEIFVRNKSYIRLVPDAIYSFMDGKFSTSHDIAVAMILAHDMLIGYVKGELGKMAAKDRIAREITGPGNRKLSWTASKSSLTELIYALHEGKVFNYGNVDIQEITSLFEAFFDVHLPHLYRTYATIKSRKGARARFLEELAFRLSQKMDNEESM